MTTRVEFDYEEAIKELSALYGLAIERLTAIPDGHLLLSVYQEMNRAIQAAIDAVENEFCRVDRAAYKQFYLDFYVRECGIGIHESEPVEAWFDFPEFMPWIDEEDTEEARAAWKEIEEDVEGNA